MSARQCRDWAPGDSPSSHAAADSTEGSDGAPLAVRTSDAGKTAAAACCRCLEVLLLLMVASALACVRI